MPYLALTLSILLIKFSVGKRSALLRVVGIKTAYPSATKFHNLCELPAGVSTITTCPGLNSFCLINCCTREIFVFSKAGVIGRNSTFISGLLFVKNSVAVLCKSVSITVMFCGGILSANSLASIIDNVLLPTPPFTFATKIDLASFNGLVLILDIFTSAKLNRFQIFNYINSLIKDISFLGH